MKKNTQNIPVSAPKFYRFIYPLLSPLMKFLFRIKVEGVENIPLQGGAIVCANHISNADAIAIGAVLPRRRGLYCLGKAELFSIPVVSAFVRGLGAIPVNRDGADVNAIRSAIKALNEGKLIAIFPQGTRRKGKNPRDTEVKNGISLILARADVPVIPVSITTKNMRCRLFRPLHIKVGEPILHETFDFSDGKRSHQINTEAIFSKVCDLGNFPSKTADTEEESI